MKMTIDEIRKLDLKELKNKLNEAKKELMNLRFQKSTDQLESTDGFKKLRHHVARLKTVINEKIKSA